MSADDLSELKASVRQLHADSLERLASQKVSDARLEKIEQHVEKVQQLIFGVNGTIPGMIIRIDRMERIFQQMRWLLTILVTMSVSVVAKMIYDVLSMPN